MSVRKIEPIPVLKTLVWKLDDQGRPKPLHPGSMMRYYYPVQIYFTRAFLLLGISSLQTTYIWGLLSLAAAAVMCHGSPLATLLACGMLYVETALDGSDGEIARYEKRYLTPQEDYRRFLIGIYVDKLLHAVCKPAIRVGLGLGLFLQSGHLVFVVAGVLLAHLILLHSIIPMIQSGTAAWFIAKAIPTYDIPARPTVPDSILARIVDKLAWYTTNGKHLTWILSLAAIADVLAGLMLPGGVDWYFRGACQLVGLAACTSGTALMAYRYGRGDALNRRIDELRGACQAAAETGNE